MENQKKKSFNKMKLKKINPWKIQILTKII